MQASFFEPDIDSKAANRHVDGMRFFGRFSQLVFGLGLYGFAGALMVRSDLGLSPWNVFHQGVARATGVSFGMATNLTGLALLPIWIALRQRIGVGTVTNALVIGSAADLSLAMLPRVQPLLDRSVLLAAGIVLTGVASGVYIGANLEPGPRDGLMTGLSRRTGWSLRATRTGLELLVLAIGLVLGGRIGFGTVAYAFSIGPLAQFFLAKFGWRSAPEPPRPTIETHRAVGGGPTLEAPASFRGRA